jgi:hypothetical protein
MQSSTWSEALSEIVESVVSAFVRFWKQDIVQVGLTLGMFLALAVPLLLVMLVLWYLDSTGWRPSSGFYKIGMSPEDLVSGAQVHAAAWGALFIDWRSASRGPGRAD